MLRACLIMASFAALFQTQPDVTSVAVADVFNVVLRILGMYLLAAPNYTQITAFLLLRPAAATAGTRRAAARGCCALCIAQRPPAGCRHPHA